MIETSSVKATQERGDRDPKIGAGCGHSGGQGRERPRRIEWAAKTPATGDAPDQESRASKEGGVPRPAKALKGSAILSRSPGDGTTTGDMGLRSVVAASQLHGGGAPWFQCLRAVPILRTRTCFRVRRGATGERCFRRAPRGRRRWWHRPPHTRWGLIQHEAKKKAQERTEILPFISAKRILEGC